MRARPRSCRVGEFVRRPRPRASSCGYFTSLLLQLWLLWCKGEFKRLSLSLSLSLSRSLARAAPVRLALEKRQGMCSVRLKIDLVYLGLI